MEDFIQFHDYKMTEQEKDELKEIIEKVNRLFNEIEEKEEYDILLHKEYNRLMDKVLNNKWLKKKNRKSYLKCLHFFKEEEDYDFPFCIMVFSNLVLSDERILEAKESYIHLLTEVFLEHEIPFTRYATYLSCLLEENISTYFEEENNKKINLKSLMHVLLDDVNFFNEKDIVLDDLRSELEKRLKNSTGGKRKNWFGEEVTIQEIYQKTKEQMSFFNNLVSVYSKIDFNRLERCKYLYSLEKKAQLDFISLIKEIDLYYEAAIEKIKQILIAIDMYSMLNKNDNIIAPEFGIERKK